MKKFTKYNLDALCSICTIRQAFNLNCRNCCRQEDCEDFQKIFEGHKPFEYIELKLAEEERKKKDDEKS